MAGLLYDDGPNGLLQFLVLTVLLGGAGAIASGRAVAGSWKSFWILPFYMIVLSAALRFLHYALFASDLLSIPGYIVALAVTFAAASLGYKAKRAEQMTTQYSWIYSKSGPTGWSPKGS